jgi:hypothetical protein
MNRVKMDSNVLFVLTISLDVGLLLSNLTPSVVQSSRFQNADRGGLRFKTRMKTLYKYLKVR